MLKYLKYLFAAIACIAVTSCSSEEDPAFGDISGRVYDYATHEPLAGAKVSLTPGTRTLTTDNSGNFAFTALESGTYTLTASLKGYTSSSSHISVNIGETSRTDILLKAESLTSNLKLSTSSLTFDKGINELTFEIMNVGENGAIKWNINLITVDWLTVTPNEGTLNEGMSNVVKVIINRNAIPENKSVSTSFNVSAGGTSKSVSVLVNNVTGGNENPVYGSVSGRVVNDADKSPVASATITDIANNVMAKSDASGNFTIANLKPGNYNFSVTAEGFEPLSKAVYVGGGAVAEAIFSLTPASTSVNVTASAARVDFGLSSTSKTLTLTNHSNRTAEWNIFKTSEYRLPAWLSVSSEGGTIPANSQKEITLRVDRSKLNDSYGVFVMGIEGEFKTIDITVTAEKGETPVVEDYSKAHISSCDYRVKAEIASCRRSGSTVTFQYTLTNNGLGTVNDWRIYPPKSMSLIQGGTRSVLWTSDGKSYDYPSITFNGKTTTGANVITATFPQGPKVSGSVTIKDVSADATHFNLTLGVYAYPNSTYQMATSAIEFGNVPIY